jgi:anti-anti-sigma regulatory factor
LVLTSGLCVLITITVALVQARMPAMLGAVPVASDLLINTLSTFILLIGVFSLFLDRFGDSLRQALLAARAREHELEQLHASLEQTVAERTAALQQALCDGERREADLCQTLADLRVSQATVRALSAPIIPVLPGVLVAPLIGDLGDERMCTLTQNVLSAIERQRARHIIFDITGVPLLDTNVAQALLQAARAARLLGAHVLLVGMRPEVAQTMVALGVTFGSLTTYADLREAISTLLHHDGMIGPDRFEQRPYVG